MSSQYKLNFATLAYITLQYKLKLTFAYLKTIVNYLLAEIYLVQLCEESPHLYVDIWACAPGKQTDKQTKIEQSDFQFFPSLLEKSIMV